MPLRTYSRRPAVRESKERKVNPKLRDQPFSAAQAAARQLLLRAIDLRFDLDETADTLDLGDSAASVAAQRLGADAEALSREIQRVAEALRPLVDGASEEDEEACEAAAAAHQW